MESSRRQSSRAIKRKKFYDEKEEELAAQATRVTEPKRRLSFAGVQPALHVSNSAGQAGVTQDYDFEFQPPSDSTFSTPPQAVHFKPKRQSLSIPVTVKSPSIKKTANNKGVATTQVGGKRVKKSNSKSSSKQVRMSNQALKDFGRWKATDDLLLVNNVEQVKDLRLVHLCVKFSCHFTQDEIETRWHTLLYDRNISSHARQAMQQLPREVADEVNKKTLFSDEEEAILCKIPSTTNQLDFAPLLVTNKGVFHSSRTAAKLEEHWKMMRKYHMLHDQSASTELSLSDSEDSDESKKDESRIETETKIAHQRVIYEILAVKKELEESIRVLKQNDVIKDDCDPNAVAVLRGRMMRYIITSNEVTFGRATPENSVDIDLSAEGPSNKISRRQGTIRKLENGDFEIYNEGKLPLFINGKSVTRGNKSKIRNDSVIQISTMSFVFEEKT